MVMGQLTESKEVAAWDLTLAPGVFAVTGASDALSAG
jgi:hypothetical protein